MVLVDRSGVILGDRCIDRLGIDRLGVYLLCLNPFSVILISFVVTLFVFKIQKILLFELFSNDKLIL